MEFLDELKSLKEQLMFKGTFDVPKDTARVVIAGMGGSGVTGKIFQELYTKTQVSLVDDYVIPEFVDKDTLFIAISYSGTTEETISALREAKKKGAHTVAITSGGLISRMVQQMVIVPKGIQPRSALGYLLMPLIKSFNVVDDKSVKEAYNRLAAIDNDNEEERLIAKEIFARRAIPVVYGIRPYKAVAYRFKVQFGETAKTIAYASSFPEISHTDTMPLRDTYRKNELYFIAFTDGKDGRIERRIDFAEKLTHTKFTRIRAEGNSTFARVMDLVHKSDYISMYLAEYRKKDPFDISAIEELKAELASG